MNTKLLAAIFASVVITLVLTTFIFDSSTPQLKPAVIKIASRVSDPIIGSEGKPVTAGVDPTPPATIYY